MTATETFNFQKLYKINNADIIFQERHYFIKNLLTFQQVTKITVGLGYQQF